MPEILYQLSFKDAASHYIDIILSLQGFEPGPLELKLAVWTPGSYMIREYSKNLVWVRADTEGNGILSTLPKISKNTFLLKGKGERTVHYRIYAAELTVRTSFIDQDHAFLNGAGIFLYVEGFRHLPVTVRIEPFDDWKQVACTLPQVKDSAFTRKAENYAALVDAPFSIGNFTAQTFQILKIPHEIISWQAGAYAELVRADEMGLIAAAETRIFGSFPCTQYLVQLYGGGKSRGGLEHRNSCSLMVQTGAGRETDRQDFLLLLAHEYFHLWNGKRLCPDVLAEPDFERENYTSLLWVVEGFTSYYESQVLLRAGLIDIPAYLGILEKTITAYLNQPGRRVQSLAESSFDAWIKFYLPDENSPNTTISYYQKGSLVALMLDLQLISGSKGRYSLDSVMKELYTRVFLKENRGYNLQDIRQVLAQFGLAELNDFFASYIDGCADPDFQHMLGLVGLSLEETASDPDNAWLGISVHKELHHILQVREGSPAAKAGLSAGDILLELDGEPFTSLAAQLDSRRPGECIRIRLLRAGREINTKVKAGTSPLSIYTIRNQAAPGKLNTELYNLWLKDR